MDASARANAVDPSRAATKPSGAYRHGDLRNALLDAAAEFVQERGGADFSLREIATRLGVSHAATYRHFESRDALVAALAARGFKAMRARFEAVVAKADTDLGNRIENLGLAYFDGVREDPGAYRVMFAPLAVIDPECAPAADACREILVDAFTEAQNHGLARQDLPASALAVTAWAALHGLGMLVIDKRLDEDGAFGGSTALLNAVRATLRDGWRAR